MSSEECQISERVSRQVERNRAHGLSEKPHFSVHRKYP